MILCGLLAAGCGPVRDLMRVGGVRELRPPSNAVRTPSTERRSRILVIGIDAMERPLLYSMLRGGELPRLAALLGSPDGRSFPHAAFVENVEAVLPSSTAPGWAAVFSGEPPGRSGIAGNEFFIRNGRTGRNGPRFVAPDPTSFAATRPLLLNYTEGYTARLLEVPTIYQRMRAAEPGLRIWVSMNPYFEGADRLLIADRWVIPSAMLAWIQWRFGGGALGLHRTLDEAALRLVAYELGRATPLPDVLTLYVFGTDLAAHVSPPNPDGARRKYAREVLDPWFAEIHRALLRRGALSNCWIVVTSDHGFTHVVDDGAHALVDGRGGPHSLLEVLGFRVRPHQLEAGDERQWSAVLAAEGAMGFVYLADRTGCTARPARCDWSRPPRFAEDVLRVADAFHRANRDGALVPVLRGTLDMVLARRPRPAGTPQEPFQVYVGHGRLVSIEEYFRLHPRADWVEVVERLRALATGPFGDRAGDVLLVSRDGGDVPLKDRYYFARAHRGMHGSPSRIDSDVPLIVAHPAYGAATIAPFVSGVLGDKPRTDRVGDLLLQLRALPPWPASAVSDRRDFAP